MKKLTIKHIAPYLDYGLQFAFLDDIDGDKGTLTGLLMFGDTPNVQLKFRGSTGLFDYEDVKPILRPLSDLTKEEFKNINHCDDEYEIKFENNHAFIVDICDINWNEVSRMHEILEWLFEKHFDIFRLIEKGLAIDINTLNK